jgi:hypothetical protein
MAAYLIEAGLVLAVAPWTPFWERNYFAHLWPAIGMMMANAYVQGAVTGIGLITMTAGVRDLLAAIFGRRATADRAPSLNPPSL